MASFYELFTVSFGKEKDREIERKDREIERLEGVIKTNTDNSNELLTEMYDSFRTLKDGVMGALGDAAPSADESSTANILAGVVSLRTQVDTLIADFAPFRQFVADHPVVEASDPIIPDEPAAAPADTGEQEAGEAAQVEAPARDEPGRFVSPAAPDESTNVDEQVNAVAAVAAGE